MNSIECASSRIIKNTHTKRTARSLQDIERREQKQPGDQVLERDISARNVTQRCTENQINRNMGAVSAARGATDIQNKQVLMVRHINVEPMKIPNLWSEVPKKKPAGAEMLKHNRKESASISHTEQQWSLTTGPMGTLLGGLQEH